jgi:phage I-like protein
LVLNWSDLINVLDDTSERLRRESDELLTTAAKLIEHAETLKARAAELKKQIARLQRCTLKPTKMKP